MVTVIIQARMDSTRFPGKIFKKIGKYTMLEHVIFQTLSANHVDKVIIATTRAKEDKKIVKFCKAKKIDYFIGSKNNVLDRFYKCALKFHCDPIVRISADSHLIDPNVIDKVIQKFLKNSYDYVSNNIEKNSKWKNSLCNYPIGTVVEISSFYCLEKAWKNATLFSEKEHVFPYVQFNPKLFKISNVMNTSKLSHIRTTVDKPDDLKFIKEIFKKIPSAKKPIVTSDIVNIVIKYPKLLEINKNTNFDEGYQKSILKNKKPHKLRIIFRVDGDKNLGMGHVFRVLSLSQKLPKKSFEVLFITKTFSAKKILSSVGKCILIKNNSSKFLTSILENFEPDMVIIDKLKDEIGILKLLRRHTKKLISIDYTGKNFDSFDYSINMLYQKTGHKAGKNFSGFEYAILNKNFQFTKPISIKKEVKSILIVQGGSDTYCFIPKIISSLNLLQNNVSLTVVIGPAFNCNIDLKKSLEENSKKIKILKNVDNMAKIIKTCDFAISAGGMTLLELCKMGVPTLVVCGEEFENETANILEKNGFGKNLGFRKHLDEKRISLESQKIISNFSLRYLMNKNGKKIIDNQGTERILKLLEIK